MESRAAPYPPSEAITGLAWDKHVIRLGAGPIVNAETGRRDGSDNWPITWADDGDLYVTLWRQHIPQPPGHRDRGDTRFEVRFGVYEAPEPWGPYLPAEGRRKRTLKARLQQIVEDGLGWFWG